MRFRSFPQSPLRTETIVYTGGVNQSVSNLELSPGELFEVINYEEIDGQHFGYRSTDGYERTDGQFLPSSILVEKDFTTVPPTITDTDRETERINVTDIPGNGYIQGNFKFNDEQYVLRDDTAIIRLYKVTPTGFTEVASFATLAVPAVSQDSHISLGRYDAYVGYENKPVAVICTGNNPAVILRDDETVEEVIDAPFITTAKFPFRSYEFNDRLFLAFDDGNLFFSGTGTPTQYDPAVDFAGVYYLKDNINDMITAPNSLLVFCEDSIHLITKTDVNIITGVNMAKEVFNDQEGGIKNTAQKIMGRIVYASKEGITTLDTTANFGDFEQAVLTKKVQRTFDDQKDNIVTSSVIRDKSQYRLYFSNGEIIALTFNIEKQIKGSTILVYPNIPSSIWEDDDNVAYFVSNINSQGVLYRRSEEAQSFDGVAIGTLMKSSFYHYKSPVQRKSFHRILTEVDASAGVRIFVQPVFDYDASQRATQQTEDFLRSGGTWNVDDWGEAGDPVDAVWGESSSAVSQSWVYINGIGYNMSIWYFTNLAHYEPHTIHNAIVSYNMASVDY